MDDELLSLPALTHPLLDPHAIIAWDMDGTLIDGPNAKFFRAYILAHPEKQHHIVTFRTGPALVFAEVTMWKDECVYELFHLGVQHGTIAKIHGMPDDLYHAWAQRKTFLQPEKVEQFLDWKGRTAAEIGATVMIDDMPGMVKKGCKNHGVVFIDAHNKQFGHEGE
jgi:hypothetical protein